jgi:carbamoyl-phosphate synthase small subunit
VPHLPSPIDSHPLFPEFRSAQIILEDGSVFHGISPSPPGVSAIAEFVFNTATTGYEEVLTDPSYGGQVVVFTTPHLGTTGWTARETESPSISVSGVVSRNLSQHYDNCLGQDSLDAVLAANHIPVVTQVDTRALVMRLRNHGTLQGVIAVGSSWVEGKQPDLQDPLVIWPRAATSEGGSFFGNFPKGSQKASKKVLVIDFGVKTSILRQLSDLGADVSIVAWDKVTVQHVRDSGAKGVVFSNGPGDPRLLLKRPDLLEIYRNIASLFPSLGICFGHQILALAHGATIEKLVFGHHALNHPVAAIDTREQVLSVAITSQNHSYAVTSKGLPEQLVVSHRHLNDGTIAGLRHRGGRFASVQYHPEAGPGPRDSSPIFDEFFARMGDQGKC